jgi:hypothetical protein
VLHFVPTSSSWLNLVERMRPRNYRVDKAEPIGSGPPKLWA